MTGCDWAVYLLDRTKSLQSNQTADFTDKVSFCGWRCVNKYNHLLFFSFSVLCCYCYCYKNKAVVYVFLEVVVLIVPQLLPEVEKLDLYSCVKGLYRTYASYVSRHRGYVVKNVTTRRADGGNRDTVWGLQEMWLISYGVLMLVEIVANEDNVKPLHSYFLSPMIVALYERWTRPLHGGSVLFSQTGITLCYLDRTNYACSPSPMCIVTVGPVAAISTGKIRCSTSKQSYTVGICDTTPVDPFHRL